MLDCIDNIVIDAGNKKLNALQGGLKNEDSSFTILAAKHFKKIVSNRCYDFSMLTLSKQEVIEKINHFTN